MISNNLLCNDENLSVITEVSNPVVERNFT
jgi:hypothetical protein